MKTIIKAIWKDPVWSTVIASFIFTFAGILIFLLTGTDYFISKKNSLKDQPSAQVFSTNISRSVLDKIILNVSTKTEIINLLGNPTDTKLKDKVPYWLYLQNCEKSSDGCLQRSLTLQFSEDNIVKDKSYAEFSGNIKVKEEKYFKKIRRGISIKKDVEDQFGIPANIVKYDNKVVWQYEYAIKIFGSVYSKISKYTLDIDFDPNYKVINVWPGGEIYTGPPTGSEYDQYYTL